MNICLSCILVKITVFYIIFYACLAAFFYLCYQIFATTLDTADAGGSPKWTQDSSLIGSNPGVGFRPMPDQDKNSESTLIWFKMDDPSDYTFWSKQLGEFIESKRLTSKLTFDFQHICTSFSCLFYYEMQNPKCQKVPATLLTAPTETVQVNTECAEFLLRC